MKKRILAFFLALMMTVSFLPAGVFAAGMGIADANSAPIDMEEFITSISFQRRAPGGEEWVDINDNNVGVGDLLRIHLFYEIPAYTLTPENNVISYQIDTSIKVLETANGEVPGSDGEPAGKFSITSDGLITIEFYDEYIKMDEDGSKLDGFVTFYSSVEAMGGVDGGQISFPLRDSVTLNVKNPEGDLAVEKSSFNVKATEGTLDYEIVVSSENGTSGPVFLSDVLTCAEVVGDISVTDRNGNPTAYEGTWPDIILPRMEGGAGYVIRYGAKLDSGHQLPTARTVTNEVTVTSVNTLGDLLTDGDTQEDRFFASSIGKVGYYNRATGKVDWTVTINSDSARRGDLSGWTLTDIYDGQPLDPDVDVTISPDPATGNADSSIVVHLPYRFPEGTKNTSYKATYSTVGNPQAKNEANLSPSDGGKGTGTGLIGPFSLNISKTGAGIFPVGTNKDGDLIVREDWIMTVDTTNGAVYADRITKIGNFIDPEKLPEVFPNGGYWILNDRLQNTHPVFLTPELQTANAQRIAEEIIASGYEGHFYIFSGIGAISDSHTLLYRTPGSSDIWDHMKENPMPEGSYQMNVIFDSDFGPGKVMTLQYSNYMNVGKGDATVRGDNFLSLNDANSHLSEGAGQYFYPVVKKVDTRKRNDGPVTEHYYDELFSTLGWTQAYDAYVLKWDFTVQLPNQVYSAPVIITEELPEGTVLYTSGVVPNRNTSIQVYIRDASGSTIFTSGWALPAVDSVYNVENSSFGKAEAAISDGIGYIRNNGYTIGYTISEDLKTVSFILSAETANAVKGCTFSFYNIPAAIESDKWDGICRSFTNNVTVSSDNIVIGSASQTQKVKHHIIDKETDGLLSGNTVPYRLTLNKESANLERNSDTLTVFDMLSYTSPTGTLMNASLLGFRVVDKTTGEDITSQCSYTLKEDHQDRKKYYFAEFIVPDEKYLEISYEYHFSGSGHLTDLSNTAVIECNSDDEDDDKVQLNIVIQDADAGAVAVGINVYKVDSSNYSVNLGGAKFILQKWTADGWVEVGPTGGFVTDLNHGMFNTGTLEKNTAYRLTETEPPKGYEMRTADVYDFFISDLTLNGGNLTVVPPASENYTGKPLNNGDHLNIPNDKIRTGDLTVRKTVTGTGADHSKAFHFTVTLLDKAGNPAAVSGSYGGMTFADGIAEFDLKDGESVKATGLPENLKYTVKEDAYPGYSVIKTGDTGTISQETPCEAAFTNSYKAKSTSVTFNGTKTLKGRPLAAEEFRFTLSGNGISETVTNGADGRIEFSTLTFTEAGTYTYTVKEEASEAAGITIDSRIYHVTVTVTDDGRGQLKAAISGDTATGTDLNFENTFRSGSLTVRKTVTGTGADQSKAFHFTVTLLDKAGNPAAVSGSYGGMTFVDGIAEFDLKDGESVKATGLPENLKYNVKEDSYPGYSVIKTGDTGTISQETPCEAAFTNSYNAKSTSVTFNGTKTLKGRPLAAEEFRFTLSGNGISETVTNGAEPHRVQYADVHRGRHVYLHGEGRSVRSRWNHHRQPDLSRYGHRNG